MQISVAYAQAPKVVPPPVLRESNYLISKRVWRVIDLEEKYNKTATWPKSNLLAILYKHLQQGELVAYTSDSLKHMYNPEVLARRGNDTDYVEVPIDPNDPTITRTDTVITPFDPITRITQLLLMEEWYFDEKHGVQKVQIIAIAPLYFARVAGVELGLQPHCWLMYYDRKKAEDIRNILVQYRMFNPNNQRAGITYFDWFEQRRFHSFIVKESNAYDISILDDPEVKKNGLQALIEAEKRKAETLHQQSDLNEY